ncbi:peptidoglycan-binding domain-containing protein [Streptomyces mirabilis]|uniref:peptidoglycan-binding domain-containing protein n=1 Tax=Streptomyces mirabilis TaxID=68239 RepID=UPI003699F106
MPTPPEPGQPGGRRAIEPTYVQRRRRTEALAQLLKEVREEQHGPDSDENYEVIAVPAATVAVTPPVAEDATEELPPVLVGEDYTRGGRPVGARGPSSASGVHRERGPAGERTAGWGVGHRRAAVVIGVTGAALVGFALALLLPGGEQEAGAQAGRAPTGVPTAAAQAPSASADPDGAGTLREGDSGPAVKALQQRLLRIPNVYDHGSTNGTYDATLTAAVARFQLWYGIRGDETGVYGNDTRADLESRTAL